MDIYLAVLVNDEKEIRYAFEQIVPFNDVRENCEEFCNVEIDGNFDIEKFLNVLENMDKEKILNGQEYYIEKFNRYEVESKKTGEVATFIGYPLTKTQYFNFETFCVEEYKDYNVKIVTCGSDLNDNSLSYDSILDMMEQTEENTLTR